MVERVMSPGVGVGLDSPVGTSESFWHFAGSNGGIVSLVGVAVSVGLGLLALYYASRYQRSTTYAMSMHHDQVLGQFAAITSLMGPGISEIVAQDIGERAEVTASQRTRESIPANGVGSERRATKSTDVTSHGNVNAIVAADVTGTGQKDLVVQNRDGQATTLRVLAFDAGFHPRVIVVLSTDRRARFATSNDAPAVLTTLENIESDHAELAKYRWTGQSIVRDDPRQISLADPSAESLLWPP